MQNIFDGYKEDPETSLKILDAVISTKVECLYFVTQTVELFQVKFMR